MTGIYVIISAFITDPKFFFAWIIFQFPLAPQASRSASSYVASIVPSSMNARVLVGFRSLTYIGTFGFSYLYAIIFWCFTSKSDNIYWPGAPLVISGFLYFVAIYPAWKAPIWSKRTKFVSQMVESQESAFGLVKEKFNMRGFDMRMNCSSSSLMKGSEKGRLTPGRMRFENECPSHGVCEKA